MTLATQTDAMRVFAAAETTLAAATATAGGVNAAANIAMMAPGFGIIGQEYLISFIIGQANNLLSVAEISAVHTATAAAVTISSVGYDATDLAGSTALHSIG